MDKQTRLEHYKILLDSFEKKRSNSKYGLCYAIDYIIHYGTWYYDNFQKEYPELYAQKPEWGGGYWWKSGDRKPRIEALKKAIELCQ